MNTNTDTPFDPSLLTPIDHAADPRMKDCVEIANWMADQILEHAELHLDTAHAHIKANYGRKYLQDGGLAPSVRKTFHDVLDERELAAEWRPSDWTWHRDWWVSPNLRGRFLFGRNQ